VVLNGEGAITLTQASGILWIKDANNATLVGFEEIGTGKYNSTMYQGSGFATISGTDMSIKFKGNATTVIGTGQGIVDFHGNGWWIAYNH